MSIEWVLFFIFGALAAVFTLWGGSLLYRALDGDRFTLQTKVEGRWVNRVSRGLLCLALLSIAIGSVLLFVTLAILGGPDHLGWVIASAVIGSAAVIVLAWSWAGRRSAGKPRCPGCGYDVSAVATDICPECGFVATTDQMWHKPRKRKRGLIAGTMLVLAAAALVAAPVLMRYNWKRLIPTAVLVAGAESLPDSLIVGEKNARFYRNGFAGTLAARAADGQLSNTQIQTLTQKTEQGIENAEEPDDLTRWLVLALVIPGTVEPKFAAEQSDRFIEKVLLSDSERTFYGAYRSRFDAVDWRTLAPSSSAFDAALAQRLRARSSLSNDQDLNLIRLTLANELDADPEAVEAAFRGVLAANVNGVTDRWTAISFLRSLPPSQTQSLIQIVWQRWLDSDDESEQANILEIVNNVAFLPDALPAEVVAKIRIALRDRLAAMFPLPDRAVELDKNWENRSMVSMLNKLLDDAMIEAVLDDAAAGSLTPGDIAVLAFAEHFPTHPFPISTLVDLAQHQDPLVRAAAIVSLQAAFEDHRDAVRPFDDAILALPRDELTDPLLERIELEQ